MNKVLIVDRLIHNSLTRFKPNAWVCDEESVEYIAQEYEEITGVRMSEEKCTCLRKIMSIDMYMDIQKSLKSFKKILK